MADLIRWQDNEDGGYRGYAGSLDDWVFQIWRPSVEGRDWLLQRSAMAGRVGRVFYGDGPDELKGRAEELLREFASSLGAVFPDEVLHEHVFTDREARPATWRTRCHRTDVPLERTMSPTPTSHYKVTCPACLRVAALEALADEILSTYTGSMAPNAARSLVPASRLAGWRAVRNGGEQPC